MANERKRSAAAVHGGASSYSKKRKMETGEKFYAVRAGKKPGIYLEWDDVQEQISGYSGANFKKFTSRQDAEAYMQGKAVKAASSGPPKFYAVAVGNPAGIYDDWSDVQEVIKNVKGAKHKKFGTRGEAVEFIKQFGNIDTIRALGEEAGSIGRALKESDGDTPPDTQIKKESNDISPPNRKIKKELQDDDGGAEGVMRIWTDGSARGNGKYGARAGFGVFFGKDDPRNVSERLKGDTQTNQRGELMAAFRAMELAPMSKDIQIITDSQYTINCSTIWAPNWRRNGWKNSKGEAVTNLDLIRPILDLIQERKEAGGRTLFQWVKGHADNPGNKAADWLANRGAEMPRPDQ